MGENVRRLGVSFILKAGATSGFHMCLATWRLVCRLATAQGFIFIENSTLHTVRLSFITIMIFI